MLIQPELSNAQNSMRRLCWRTTRSFLILRMKDLRQASSDAAVRIMAKPSAPTKPNHKSPDKVYGLI